VAKMSKMTVPGHREEVLADLEELLRGRSDVQRGYAFGKPRFYGGNNKLVVFCFGEGIRLKLPVERVAALVAADPDKHLKSPNGRETNEWVHIARQDAEKLRQDRALIEEAIAFVSRDGANESIVD
jgi:hypothetical protein